LAAFVHRPTCDSSAIRYTNALRGARLLPCWRGAGCAGRIARAELRDLAARLGSTALVTPIPTPSSPRGPSRATPVAQRRTSRPRGHSHATQLRHLGRAIPATPSKFAFPTARSRVRDSGSAIPDPPTRRRDGSRATPVTRRPAARSPLCGSNRTSPIARSGRATPVAPSRCGIPAMSSMFRDSACAICVHDSG